MLPNRQPPSAFDPKRASMTYRRALPHLAQDHVIYFVTFRLHDSIPQPKLQQWTAQLRQWKNDNPLPHTPQQVEAFANLGYRRIERWLDRCDGTCLLRDSSARQIVGDCLEYRDGQDYSLGDYIIMPNHVHLLVQVAVPHALKDITKTWYGVTTHRINKALDRQGTLWQSEPFDHIVRDENSLSRIRLYIQTNGHRLPPNSWHYSTGTLFALPPAQ